MAALPDAQQLNHDTHAVHAAGVLDAGRAGWSRCARMSAGTTRSISSRARWRGADVAAAEGMLLLSSRLSVELVQKAAAIGAPVIVAVSAPTALAMRVAEAAGITLVGVARQDGFEVFTHAERIEMERGAACRLTSWPIWPTRSAGSLLTSRTTRRWLRPRTPAQVLGSADAGDRDRWTSMQTDLGTKLDRLAFGRRVELIPRESIELITR